MGRDSMSRPRRPKGTACRIRVNGCARCTNRMAHSRSNAAMAAASSRPCAFRIMKSNLMWTMAAEWTVLIADDEPAARRGVRQLLAPYSDFTVCGEARNGAETLTALDASRPDLLFLDVQMPGIDGFEVIRRRTPDRMPVVIFLTAY